MTPNQSKYVTFCLFVFPDDNDDGSNDDSEYNDDEADETWEDPGKLYCICRQPHNKRYEFLQH